MPPEIMRFCAKKTLVLITGGERGIGKYLADQFLESGASVIVTSRTAEFLEDIIIQENALIVQQLDVADEDSVKRLFTWITFSGVKLDILVNNAGIGFFKPLVDTTLNEWEQTISTNLTGAFLTSKEACKLMNESGGGRIINIGSIADKFALNNNASYGASKCGLKGLSSILSEEEKYNKIRVTHITLGAVYTEIWKERINFLKDDMLDPVQVAQLIAYIALLPTNMRIDNIEITPEKGIL